MHDSSKERDNLARSGFVYFKNDISVELQKNLKSRKIDRCPCAQKSE